MSITMDYYNNNADQYYWTTVGVDLDATRKRFASYLPAEASIIDMGCGSGRDVLAFCDMGYNAIGLDASEELVSLARERLGIKAYVGDMSYWLAEEPFDGIWCCASLMHLDDAACRRFFLNLNNNLKPGGVLYISVKSGIETGIDKEGRYLRDFSEEEMLELIESVKGLHLKELWYTEDALSRRNFRWLNVIAKHVLP